MPACGQGGVGGRFPGLARRMRLEWKRPPAPADRLANGWLSAGCVLSGTGPRSSARTTGGSLPVGLPSTLPVVYPDLFGGFNSLVGMWGTTVGGKGIVSVLRVSTPSTAGAGLASHPVLASGLFGTSPSTLQGH